MEFESQELKIPETVPVTERTYEQYIDKLHIPEEYLKNRGVVIDIGAGFSNFSQKVNESFSETGTKAYAIDPVYTFFEGDFNKFEKSLEGSGLSLEFIYGRNFQEEPDIEKYSQGSEKLYYEFYKEAIKDGSYIAGSHQKLPFNNESVDLVVGNNSIFRFNNREITTNALKEIIRALKKDGEARIGPTYFDFDKEHREVSLVKYGDQTKQDIEEQVRTGKSIDRVMFKAFKDMELTQGIKFYVGIDQDIETGQTLVQDIIFRKDEKVPEINTNDPFFYELRKISFADSEDQFFIPSEVINIKKSESKV